MTDGTEWNGLSEGIFNKVGDSPRPGGKETGEHTKTDIVIIQTDSVPFAQYQARK